MKKLFSVLAAFMLLLTCSVSFASVGVILNGTPNNAATDIRINCGTGTNSAPVQGGVLNLNCSPNLATAGIANGGATSQASTVAAISTSYAFVRKVIPSNTDASFNAGTLANGIPGQMLTVYVAGITPSNAQTGGNYTLTPTTTTGFASIKFTAVKDFATFLYLDDTNGWVLLNSGGSVTITLK